MSLSRVAQDLYPTFSGNSSAGGFVCGVGKEELLWVVLENTMKKSVERLTALVSMTLSCVF